MKNLLKKSLLTTASLLVAVSFADNAQAQTAPVTVSTTVQNTLTLATAQQMNFGTVVAVGATGNTATIVLATDGTVTTATGGGTAYTAVIDDTAATNAQITIEDGAPGATINVNITNVVDPTDGTDTFTLDTFVTSYNGGGDTPRTAGTPFTRTYDAAFGGGVNTLDIGATLTTIDPSTAYGDGAYAGSFDVVFSY